MNIRQSSYTKKSLSLDAILAKALALEDLTPTEGLFLLQVGQDCQGDRRVLNKIQQTANQLRQELVGDTVTYVVNHNINFTNICEQHCSFCAFRRDAQNVDAFWLNGEKILIKAQYAVTQGATEICMQGGLNPDAKIEGSSLAYYRKLITDLKSNFPQLHLHAFSPQEIQFIAREDHLSYEQVLKALKQAGLDSIPGTAAEVLSDRVRKIICPEKLDSRTWLEIVSFAHRLGIPTTSTMLCGHIETPEDQITHLEHLRSLQTKAVNNHYPARISEFILLPFVGEQAPKTLRNRVGRDQPELEATLLLTAVARLYLGKWIIHHQPSWVKLGVEGAKQALNWGCDDLGGTLMEEHITTMAGAKGGTCLTIAELQEAIQALHRPFCQRTTLYQLVAM